MVKQLASIYCYFVTVNQLTLTSVNDNLFLKQVGICIHTLKQENRSNGTSFPRGQLILYVYKSVAQQHGRQKLLTRILVRILVHHLRKPGYKTLFALQNLWKPRNSKSGISKSF